MNLSTPLKTSKSEIEIDSQSKLLTMGSCFSDNIGNKLEAHQFNALVNPYGTVFNPISLSKLLDRSMNKTLIEIAEIDTHGERSFHYDFHSSFDSTNPDSVVSSINESINLTSEYINNTDILILTFGTSIAYRKLSDHELVSNCHKVPNKQFERIFIPIDEMVSTVSQSIEQFLHKRPNLRVVITVSPVRHTKEGLIDNLRSKSRLIETCHLLSEQFKTVEYFPSYEIMIDELRDYRYYDADMIHPSPLAVDMIWKTFMDTYFSEAAIRKVIDLDKLNRAANHRPFDSSSEGHKKFCLSQLKEIEKLQELYKEVDFEKYKEMFK